MVKKTPPIWKYHLPPLYCTMNRFTLEGCNISCDSLAVFLGMKFLYKFWNSFAFYGWLLFGKVKVEDFWLNSACRRAFKKSFLYLFIVLILSQTLQRLHCLEVLSLFCHQPYLLNPNECEKREKSGFTWLFQQYVENGQIATEDDSLGNPNSPAFSSVGT